MNWQPIATKSGLSAWNTAAGITITVSSSTAGIPAGMLLVTVFETLPAGINRRFHRLEASQQ